MTLVIHDDKVPIRIEENGAVRVGPTRVTLEVVLNYYKQGMSAEQLVRSFPTLKLEDVYLVLAYYLKNQNELDLWLDECDREAELIRQKIESQPGYAERTAQLKARMEALRNSNVSPVGR